jgi:hypothetical protein
MKRTYWIVLIMLVVATAASYIYNEYNRKLTDVAELLPTFSLAAPALLNEFAADDSAATTKFLNQVIRVHGTVKQIDSDPSGFHTIVLSEPASMSAVRCSLDSIHNHQAASVATGNIIDIQGVCSGYTADELGIGADLLLHRCTIIK